MNKYMYVYVKVLTISTIAIKLSQQTLLLPEEFGVKDCHIVPFGNRC